MPYRIYRVQSMENDMTENPDMMPNMMPEMMIAATTGDIYTGGCHFGAVRFWVTGPVGKILICHFFGLVK